MPASINPIRAYRESQGLSLDALARRLDTAKSNLWRLENDTQQVTADGDGALLFRLVETTGIPAEKLRPDLAELFGKRRAA